MASHSHIDEVSRRFRQLLVTGSKVAIEDATPNIKFPRGFDKRSLGCIPLQMLRNGEIAEAGFRRGVSKSCNQATKRLWIATDLLKIGKREDHSRG